MPAPTDPCVEQLHGTGWSAGEVRILTPAGPAWQVDGINGENVLLARGATPPRAWAAAFARARSLGMLGRQLLTRHGG